jgi:DNA-binding LytR/AlgR family response regulator
MALPDSFIPRTFEQVIWLEGDRNYTWIHQQGRPAWLSSYTLGWYQARLAQFIRVNKSSLVNPRFVARVERQRDDHWRYLLWLTNGAQVILSRRRQPEILEQLEAFQQQHNLPLLSLPTA